MALRRLSTPALGPSLLALGVLLALIATMRFGGVAVAAILALAGATALVSRPEWALGAAVAVPVLVETEADWGPSSAPARVYELIPGTKLSPVEALVLLALLAVVLRHLATRAPLRSLGGLSAPLALLALALVAGAVTGHDAGTGLSELVNASRGPLLLLVVAALTPQVVGPIVPLRTALGFLLGLAAVKGVLGIAALLTGNTATSVGDQALTYYDAPANLLTMLALLFVVAGALRRVRLPTWAWAAAPFLAASLLFSYRRSFWVACVLGLVLVLLGAAGRQGRWLGLPAVVAIGVALFLSLGSSLGGGLTGGSGKPESGLGGRLSTLSPGRVSQSKDDRYRAGERRNVLEDLERAPISGLGLGVSYTARQPLSLGDLPRDYVHFAALWWWMKTGILGLIAYVSMLATAIWIGARVFSRHPDRAVAAAGLAGAAGLVGYAVAETTATFTGPDVRSCILVGLLLGLLAAARRETFAPEALAR